MTAFVVKKVAYNYFCETNSFKYCLFILCYAQRYCADRFRMSKGTVYRRAWPYSKCCNQYDLRWRERNFPEENFFGKIRT